MYRSPTKPLAHQSAALKACKNKPPAPCPEDVFALLMEQGTGKSKVILDEFGGDASNGGPQDLLLMAPAGSYRNWFRDKGESPDMWSELRKHLDPDFRERLIDVHWQSGPNKALRERLEAMLKCKDKKRPRALFMNIEAISRRGEARELVLEFMSQRNATIVVDESTVLRTHDSDRTKFMTALSMQYPGRRRILSGLWNPNKPLDIFGQCFFMDWRILGYKRYNQFRDYFAEIVKVDFGGRWPAPVIKGYRHLEELEAKVAPYRYRVLKKDCLDLPEKLYLPRHVELTPEQRRIRQELKLFGHAAIGESFVTTDMVLKRITRELQVNCGYIMDDERVLREVPENRTDALISVLQEHDGKALIWCPWHPPLRKIIKRLKEEFGEKCCAEFHGKNLNTRSAEETRFLNDPECLYMVATQGAGMRGNTWVNADLVVYYSNNYDLEQREQSEDRSHRMGQKRQVTYVDLIAEGSIDDKVVKSLRDKISIAALVNGETARNWL